MSNAGPRWSIVLKTPVATSNPKNWLLLGDVFQYWALPDDALVRPILKLSDGSVQPAGRSARTKGVPSLLLARESLEQLRKSARAAVVL